MDENEKQVEEPLTYKGTHNGKPYKALVTDGMRQAFKDAGYRKTPLRLTVETVRGVIDDKAYNGGSIGFVRDREELAQAIVDLQSEHDTGENATDTKPYSTALCLQLDTCDRIKAIADHEWASVTQLSEAIRETCEDCEDRSTAELPVLERSQYVEWLNAHGYSISYSGDATLSRQSQRDADVKVLAAKEAHYELERKVELDKLIRANQEITKQEAEMAELKAQIKEMETDIDDLGKLVAQARAAQRAHTIELMKAEREWLETYLADIDIPYADAILAHLEQKMRETK